MSSNTSLPPIDNETFARAIAYYVEQAEANDLPLTAEILRIAAESCSNEINHDLDQMRAFVQKAENKIEQNIDY